MPPATETISQHLYIGNNYDRTLKMLFSNDRSASRQSSNPTFQPPKAGGYPIAILPVFF